MTTQKGKELQKAGQPISVSANVAQLYKATAGLGAENLSASIPQLKITESNSDNRDINDEAVPAGNLYYTPTKEYFKEVVVSVMTISRGFYAMDNGKEPKPKFTQLLGGTIIDTLQPFVMFMSGTRLQNMWTFGKEISPLTKHKMTPIPMYAFKVKLALEPVKTDYGTNNVATFDLVKNDDGQIELIDDENTVKALIHGVAKLESMFDSFIEQKEVDKQTGRPITQIHVEEDPATPTHEEIKKGSKEDVNPSDIPF